MHSSDTTQTVTFSTGSFDYAGYYIMEMTAANQYHSLSYTFDLWIQQNLEAIADEISYQKADGTDLYDVGIEYQIMNDGLREY